MPIVLTPSTSTSTTVQKDTCLPTKVEGVPVLGRKQAFRVAQGQIKSFEFTFRDFKGNPIDLSVYDFATGKHRLLIRAIEALSISSSASYTEIDAEVESAGDGLVSFTTVSKIVEAPGIDDCQIGVLDEDDNLLVSDAFWLIVDRSHFGPSPVGNGPPTIDEIRLRLRDSSPEDNYLLKTVEFDDAEIADAIIETIRYWNESQPPIPQRYNTATFPFPGYAFLGILGRLYMTAAAHYRREDVDYTQAGVSFNDKKKHRDYEQIGMARWAEYAKIVRDKKVQISMENGFSIFPSPYYYR